MNYLKIFVLSAVTLSLFINFSLLSKVNDLKKQVQSISSFQQHLNNNVNMQTSNVNNIINEFKREQSWLSPVTTNYNTAEIGKGKVGLKFEWQVKELKKDSKVVFNYKYGNEKDYTAVNAVEKNNGLFEANIPIDVKAEPEWDVVVRNVGNNTNELSKQAVQEVKKVDSNNAINYFITSSLNDMIKSSEINTQHIGNLGSRFYGNLQVNLNFYENKSYSISVAAIKNDDNTTVSLKEVYLRKYKNGQLASEDALDKSDIRINSGAPVPVADYANVYNTKPLNEKLENVTLIIKAVYSDGKVFEKDVYSK